VEAHCLEKSKDSPNPVQERDWAFQQTDVTRWDSQVAAFKIAVRKFGRIDIVVPCAGIGERRWLPKLPDRVPGDDDFIEPDLKVIHVNLTSVLYTLALATQQFARQPKTRSVRGKGERVVPSRFGAADMYHPARALTG
jgi:NAD(P)-dependent dehydrogenase (short-subunit alcohol dehydrogenase family)